MIQSYGLYNYLARVVRVVDGDTIELEIDLGFKLKYRSTCRMYGINTPELRVADQKVAAQAAKNAVQEMLPAGTGVRIESRELDKYGRPLAEVYLDGRLETSLNQWLIDNGHAKPYK